jgi:hypothetical protein
MTSAPPPLSTWRELRRRFAARRAARGDTSSRARRRAHPRPGRGPVRRERLGPRTGTACPRFVPLRREDVEGIPRRPGREGRSDSPNERRSISSVDEPRDGGDRHELGRPHARRPSVRALLLGQLRVDTAWDEWPARVPDRGLTRFLLNTRGPSWGRLRSFWQMPGVTARRIGADEGNRTPVSSLGSLRSAIEPHPRERPDLSNEARPVAPGSSHHRPPSRRPARSNLRAVTLR